MLNNINPVIANAIAPFVAPACTKRQQQLLNSMQATIEDFQRYIDRPSMPERIERLRLAMVELREYWAGDRSFATLSATAKEYSYDIRPEDTRGT